MIDHGTQKKSVTVTLPEFYPTVLAFAGILLLLCQAFFAAQVSTDLWYWLWHSPIRWQMTMMDGMNFKPPGIAWLGELFVGLRHFLGSVEVSLLLSILLTRSVLLYILYKIGVRMFPDGPLIYAAGVIFTAAAQLFAPRTGRSPFPNPAGALATGGPSMTRPTQRPPKFGSS